MADKLIRLNLGDSYVDLPADDLATDLKAAGIDLPPRHIKLGEVEHFPLNDEGRELLAKCRPSDSLVTTDLACSLMVAPTETLNFYCPMLVQCYDGEDEDPIELGNNYLALHEEEVRAAVLGMVDYNAVTDHLPGELQGKIASIRWDIAKIGDEIYGKITAEIRAPLTAAEQEKLAGWIYNQNEGAHGDGFEQLLMDTDDGELCVSFWNSSPDCYVLPEDEFRAQVLGEQIEEPVEGQGLGGMEGMPPTRSPGSRGTAIYATAYATASKKCGLNTI